MSRFLTNVGIAITTLILVLLIYFIYYGCVTGIIYMFTVIFNINLYEILNGIFHTTVFTNNIMVSQILGLLYVYFKSMTQIKQK